MTDHAKVEEAAARWVASEDRTLSDNESAALVVWLEETAANKVAYLRLKASWQRTTRLAALRNSRSFSLHVATPTWNARVAVMAASFVILAGFGAFAILHPISKRQPATYIAKSGSHPTVRLSDGTSIQLNGHTQVQTSITAKSRTVTLSQGEAYFEVVHDETRPFVVFAGNYRITDLGTKFSVLREGDNVRVLVAEGQVRVDVLNKTLPVSPVFVESGNVVVAKADETLVASKSLREISDALSWRTGMLIFNKNTLAEAAAEFNRYNSKQIVVEGPARDIPIGGSFRADNIEVFSSLVHNAVGLSVVDQGDKIIISK